MIVEFLTIVTCLAAIAGVACAVRSIVWNKFESGLAAIGFVCTSASTGALVLVMKVLGERAA